MAVVTPINLTLPAVSASYSAPSSSSLSAPVPRAAYPAGPSYLASARRQLLQRSFAEDDAAVQAQLEALRAQQASDAGETLFPGLGEEEEAAQLLQSDPKEWKKQDHYAVLGLGGLRYKATDEHIKVAHRRKVLRHHPDKKAGSKTIAHVGTNDDAFFKCIQKAHETLTNAERRRQFDSVDWNIEDEVPDLRSIPADKFCSVIAPVFAREGRFSNVQPVAAFGDNEAPKKEVEGFYDFWYNFDSWRSFEWHDKEVNEGSDSRDDKRFTEKKNKTERARRKKEDNVRVRELVDAVLAADPRIKRIKEEEKAARLAKKGGGKAAGANGAKTPGAAAAAPAQLTPAQKKAAEAAKKEEEKKALEATKGDREAAKKAKEAARKNLKKWKKAISTVIASSNYFQPAGSSPSAKQIEAQLTELDALCELLEPEEVKELKDQVEGAGAGDAAKAAIAAKVGALGDKGAGKFVEFA